MDEENEDKCGYNMEKFNVDDLSFPWEKLLCIFHKIYDFIITITRIHCTMMQPVQVVFK